MFLPLAQDALAPEALDKKPYWVYNGIQKVQRYAFSQPIHEGNTEMTINWVNVSLIIAAFVLAYLSLSEANRKFGLEDRERQEITRIYAD